MIKMITIRTFMTQGAISPTIMHLGQRGEGRILYL